MLVNTRVALRRSYPSLVPDQLRGLQAQSV